MARQIKSNLTNVRLLFYLVFTELKGFEPERAGALSSAVRRTAEQRRVQAAGDMGMPAAPLLVGVIFGARGMWHLGWAVCIAIAALSLVACVLLLGNKRVRN